MYKNTLYTIFTFLLLAANLECKPEITWYKSDLPPFYIKSGPYKNKGIGDTFQSFLESKLPEYNHKTIYSNVIRMDEDSKSSKLFATLILYKSNTREKFLLFSNPYGVGVPPKVFFTPHNKLKFKKYISSDNIIDLDKVFNDPNIIICIPTGRFYSKNINSILNKYKNNKNIFFNYNVNYIRSSLKMLYTKRVDCFIEFELMVNYTNTFENISDKLESASIFSPDKFVYSSVSVSKTNEGTILISKINSIINQYYFTDEYLNIFTLFGSKNYKNYYQQILKKGYKEYYKTSK